MFPAWYPFDAVGFFEAMAAQGQRCAPLQLACAPYIATMLADARGTDPLGERIPLAPITRWRERMRRAVHAFGADLLSTCRAEESGASERYFAAMLFIFEMSTREREDALAPAVSIATGETTLADVLASLELGPAPAIPLEPAALKSVAISPPERSEELESELSRMGKLTSGAVEVPIPADAETVPGGVTSFVPNAKLVVMAIFVAPIGVDGVVEIYRRWARAYGWGIEHESHGVGEAELVLVRHRQHVVLVVSVADPSGSASLLRVGIHPGRTATFLASSRIVAAS